MGIISPGDEVGSFWFCVATIIVMTISTSCWVVLIYYTECTTTRSIKRFEIIRQAYGSWWLWLYYRGFAWFMIPCHLIAMYKFATLNATIKKFTEDGKEINVFDHMFDQIDNGGFVDIVGNSIGGVDVAAIVAFVVAAGIQNGSGISCI